MQDGKTVYPGHHVIEHDSESTVETLIEKINRKGLYNIEYAKKGEAKSHGQRCHWNRNHGYQHTHDFIDYHGPGISGGFPGLGQNKW